MFSSADVTVEVFLLDNLIVFLFADPLEDVVENTSQSVTNSAAELLKQGAGNRVCYISCYEKTLSQTGGVTLYERWRNLCVLFCCRNEPFSLSCYYAMCHWMHLFCRYLRFANPSVILNLSAAAACNVWFLGSVEMESLTGVQAVQKATTMVLNSNAPPTSTVVHFKVSSQGITLTDNQRKWVNTVFALFIYA